MKRETMLVMLMFVGIGDLMAEGTNIVFKKTLADGREVIARETIESLRPALSEQQKELLISRWTNMPSALLESNGCARCEMVIGIGEAAPSKIWEDVRDYIPSTHHLSRCSIYDVVSKADKFAIMYQNGGAVCVDIIEHGKGMGLAKKTYQVCLTSYPPGVRAGQMMWYEDLIYVTLTMGGRNAPALLVLREGDECVRFKVTPDKDNIGRIDCPL